MDSRTEIRDAKAQARYELYQEIGATVQYSHEGADNVDVICMPDIESLAWFKSENIDIDKSQIKLKIPRQPNFPPASEVVTTLDIFIYNNLEWVFISSEKDKYGAVWTVTIEADRATDIRGS